MSLTPKERVIAQIQHQETEPLPYSIGFEGDVAEQLDAYYGSTAWRESVDNSIQSLDWHEWDAFEAADCEYTDVYGSKWQVDCRPFHLIEPVLKEPTLDGYTFPAVETIYDDEYLARSRAAIAAKPGHFWVAYFGFGLFERSWTLRGFNNALMDAAAYEDFYQELIDQIAAHQMAIVERLLLLPLDGVMFSDDWGYQKGILLGPDRWRRMLKPRLAEQYARVHDAGKYVLSHCCGNIADIMPDVIEIGLDVYESVQPEVYEGGPYSIKRQFGDQITFWGGLGSQSIIPFGTPAEIRAEVAKLSAEMGQGGGYILGLAKSLQPETPVENAAAVVESFMQQVGVPFPA